MPLKYGRVEVHMSRHPYKVDTHATPLPTTIPEILLIKNKRSSYIEEQGQRYKLAPPHNGKADNVITTNVNAPGQKEDHH